MSLDRYLNFASYGPITGAALAASHDIDRRAAAGAPAARLHAADDRATAAAAALTGFAPENVVLSSSTSAGLMQAAFAMPPGRVLVSRAEFPANLYPWWRAAEAGRISVGALRPADPRRPLTVDDLAGALTADTVAVSVSAVSFRTGHRADLAAIREAIGDRLLVVDAIQGMGVVDEDWQVADVVVSGGQKWLRSGWGTGFAAFSDRALERLVPALSGWTGAERSGQYSGDEHPRRRDARRFTMTNGSPGASAALAAGIGEVLSTGIGEVAAAVHVRAAELRRLLAERRAEVVTPEEHAGIVVARLGADAHARLAVAGFATTLVDGDGIRFAPHATTPVAVLAEAVDVACG
ncbi:aminotransferase class V-fold PLP-dependent enzyme [Microbacterium indicum]|uniref:aminotransferase class V-fold PLP-dependent enzyme n=1 Tax=Microbacterium indicum TaxID=358100 RepID=UPI00041989E6|nr:aminotransferase class V-fold PLP-dependent enzyme [Microbacterium indicum]